MNAVIATLSPPLSSQLRADAFDRRLSRGSPAPIAVAFSGGGDSLAGLILTKAWADRCGRGVVAICVDHRLQAESGAWTRRAGETARRLGARFEARSWDGPKPERGLAAAARMARHRLIAEAARAAGARVVVFAHTADDELEAELMRAGGSMLGGLREWSPSPVWPQGRGLFILRPLLGLRRADIREALRGLGETWIDDPANLDPRSTRARARAELAGRGLAPPVVQDDARLAVEAGRAELGDIGAIRLDRRRLLAAPPASARRLLAAAMVCAGGGERPPRGDRLDVLLARLAGANPVVATLVGAKALANGDEVLIVRDAGETRRGGLLPLTLQPGETGVWDGRFELTAGAAVVEVRALAGRAAQLAPDERRALARTPAAARGALPLVTAGPSAASCPFLAERSAIEVRSLIAERFVSACGAVSQEPAI